MTRKWTFLMFALLFSSLQAQDYKVRSFCWERIEVTSELDATPSEVAANVVAPYKASVDSIMAPPLGLSRVAMNAKRPESLLSNWAADVMVEGGTATGLEPADMGLINIGGLRNNMPEGIVRRGDVMLISPFENYMVVLEMKGSDLLGRQTSFLHHWRQGNRPASHLYGCHDRLPRGRKRQDALPEEGCQAPRHRHPRTRHHDGIHHKASCD